MSEERCTENANVSRFGQAEDPLQKNETCNNTNYESSLSLKNLTILNRDDESSAENSDNTKSDKNGKSSSNNDQMCIICKSLGDETLKHLVEKTWGSLKKAAQFRLLLKSDRYKEVTTELNLVENMDDIKYHSKCFRNYTAVKRSSISPQSDDPIKKPATRLTSLMPSSNELGLLKGSCIFCTVQRKTINRKIEPLSECLTKEGCDALIEAAPKSSNERLKSLLASGIDLIAKEAQYHKSCRRDFFRETDSAVKTTSVSFRHLHATAFEVISNLIERDIILNKKAMFATSIMEFYKTVFLSEGGLIDDIEGYTVQPLMKKIKDKFGSRISVAMFDQRKGNFVYSSKLSDGDARESLLNDEEKQLHVIRTAALYLRNFILKLPKWKTPYPTSVESLKACSPELPKELTIFYKTLICGLREPSGDDTIELLDRKVIGMSSDAIYNTTRGTVRPWKHTVLGLGIGTLTGSKQVLRILNRLGNSISYDEIKTLETEFAYSVEEKHQDTPDGVEHNPELATALAWDNYDVNMETVDGKNTLHSTVGICYQNILTPSPGDEVSSSKDVTSTIQQAKNRRSFKKKGLEIMPYHKQLKKAYFNLPVLKENEKDNKLPSLQLLDFFWLLQSSEKNSVPLFLDTFHNS